MGTKMDPAGEGGGDFEVVTAGLHDAVLCEFEDMGEVEEEFEGKKRTNHKGRYIFQVAEREADGQRRKEVAFKFNMTWGKAGWPSKALKVIEKWAGQPLTDKQKAEFEHESVVGRSCRVSVAHFQTSDGTRAFVDGIFKPGEVKLKPENYTPRAERKKEKKGAVTPPASSSDDPFGATTGGDDVPV